MVHGELFRAATDDENVIRFFHHRLGHERRVFYFLNRADGARAPRRAVHNGSVQFDHALFVGQAAVADGIVVGVVFDLGDYGENGIERVAATFQEVHSVVQMLQAIGRGDDQRANAFCGRRCLRKAEAEFACHGSSRAEKTACASGDAAGQSREKEFSARPFFH